jgi:hypothetical protein
MFSGFFPRPEPSAPISFGAAGEAMVNDLASIDNALSKQFKFFKDSLKELTVKVKRDQQSFNASRRQKMPSNDLTVPLEKEALDITGPSGAVGSGMYYGRKRGSGKLNRVAYDADFRFANKHGISKYI